MFNSQIYLVIRRRNMTPIEKCIYFAKAKARIRRRYPIADCPLSAYGLSILPSCFMDPARLPL